MHAYTLTPNDLLFFRDARPIASVGGHGARWPEPSVIFDAIHAALWRAFPDAGHSEPWEHAHRFGRSSQRDMNRSRSQRFGSLVTAGLFPVWKEEHWLLPAPADATTSGESSSWLLRPTASAAGQTGPMSNLPRPLRHPVANFAPPTKETPSPWWTANAWEDYLKDQRPAPDQCFDHSDLFSGEWTTGIGIDPATGTQDGERIYSAEYLRLRPDVRCGFLASLAMKQNGEAARSEECIGKLFASNRSIIVGGQQRVCQVEGPAHTRRLPLPVGKTRNFTTVGSGEATRWLVKWVLMTPAIWPRIATDTTKVVDAHPGGWLPNWIHATVGDVLLKHRSGDIRRVWDEQRKRTVRRAEHEEQIKARLVAAVVPKPIPITGWTERLHLIGHEEQWRERDEVRGPKSTHLAVPAGAVYYFEADSEPDAQHLAAALNWHGAEKEPTRIVNRRSTLMGEKGFGLGVCGTWQFHGTGGSQ